MVAPDNSFWFYVELNLLSKVDGTTTDTIKLTNRPFIDNEAEAQYWPLLLDVSGIGVKLGEFIPQPVQGSIVIDNSPNSFGYQRRFSDLLERYTLIDQVVNIYLDDDTQDDFSADNFALAWSSKCTNYRMDFSDQRQTLTLTLAAYTVPHRIITKVIDSVQFPYAPASSLGQHLPIVFGGNIQVKPLMVTAEGDTAPEFAYATTLADDYVVGGVQTYYVKDETGEYFETPNPAAITTVVGGVAPATPTLHSLVLSGTYEYAQIADFTASAGVVTNGTFYWANFTGGSHDYHIVVSVYESSPSFTPSGVEYPGEKVTEGRFSIASSTGVNTVYSNNFSFDKPIYVKDTITYWVGVYVETDNVGSVTEVDFISNAAASNTTTYKRDIQGGTSSNQARDWLALATISTQQWCFQLFGVRFSDDTTPSGAETNADGLGHAYFTATQNAAATDQINPDISKLDLIVEIQGLLDTSGGTVTGSASALITSPQYAIELLDKEWNGTIWTGGRLNTSEHSATHAQVNSGTGRYHRALAGKTEGETYLDQLYSDILRNTACRLTLYNAAYTTNLAFWAWGANTTATTVIDDEQAKIIQINQLGTETIVNRVQMYYARRLVPVDFVTGSAQGQFKAYAGTLDWDSTYSALTTEYSELSEAVYGKRYLRTTTFDWLGDTTSAEHIAEYYLASYAHPIVQVIVEVPYSKFSSLDMLDVVEIVHPDLPSYYGTASQGNFPVYSFTHVHITRDHYLKRATRYRAIIEGKELNLSNKEYPTLKLTLKLLLNYGKDPT